MNSIHDELVPCILCGWSFPVRTMTMNVDERWECDDAGACGERAGSRPPGTSAGLASGPRPAKESSLNLRLAELETEIARLRAGEDPSPYAPNIQLTPAQWIYYWNSLDAEVRLAVAGRIFANSRTAETCHLQNHAARLEECRHQIEELRSGAVHARLAAKLDQIALLAYKAADGDDGEPAGLARAIVDIIEGRTAAGAEGSCESAS